MDFEDFKEKFVEDVKAGRYQYQQNRGFGYKGSR